MPNAHDQSKAYALSVNTDDVYEAIAQTSDALYTFIEEALASHIYHEAEDCQFGILARDLLGVLNRHADQLTAGQAPECASDAEGEKKWPYV